jgi:hypothetical protein
LKRKIPRGKQMAIEIKFTGYVKEVKSGVSANSGKPWALAKVVHNQVKRNADDTGWENSGKDYFDVFLPEGVTVTEDERIEIVGRLKTNIYDKADGSKGIGLSVNAQTVQVAEAFKKSAPAASAKPATTAAVIPDSWTAVDDSELPF